MCTSCGRGRSIPPAPKPKSNSVRNTGARKTMGYGNSFGTPKIKLSFSSRRRSG